MLTKLVRNASFLSAITTTSERNLGKEAREAEAESANTAVMKRGLNSIAEANETGRKAGEVDHNAQAS